MIAGARIVGYIVDGIGARLAHGVKKQLALIFFKSVTRRSIVLFIRENMHTAQHGGGIVQEPYADAPATHRLGGLLGNRPERPTDVARCDTGLTRQLQ